MPRSDASHCIQCLLWTLLFPLPVHVKHSWLITGQLGSVEVDSEVSHNQSMVGTRKLGTPGDPAILEDLPVNAARDEATLHASLCYAQRGLVPEI